MTINVGDKVAFSAAFCRNIGAQTGEVPAMRGTVVEVFQVAKSTIATVDWQNGEPPTRTNANNLAVVGSLKFGDTSV